MSHRINISIPDDLGKEIRAWGNLLNISQICQEAISHQIDQLKRERRDRSGFVQKIKSKILMRRDLLVRLAKGDIQPDPDCPIDETDRIHILTYLEQEEIPEKPHNIGELMKVYASSCLSQSIIRRRLTRLLGRIPTPETIPKCLEAMFGTADFRKDRYWTPTNLPDLLVRIQKQEDWADRDLRSIGVKPRIMGILIDGAGFLQKKLQRGLSPFYEEISAAIENGPEATWKFANRFSSHIRHVGPATVCDFLKNIGFPDFVRVEGHFRKEFPELINEKYMSQKQQFIVSLTLCEELELRPFFFDHIMYQWGRYKHHFPEHP
jgi:hypothetical protein